MKRYLERRFRNSGDRSKVVAGLQPLVGSAEELAGGSGGSITIGSYTLDSNSVALLDALIAASLRESAKAYQAPPIVTGEIASGLQPMRAGRAKPPLRSWADPARAAPAGMVTEKFYAATRQE